MGFIKFRNISKVYFYGLLFSLQICSVFSQSHTYQNQNFQNAENSHQSAQYRILEEPRIEYLANKQSNADSHIGNHRIFETENHQSGFPKPVSFTEIEKAEKVYFTTAATATTTTQKTIPVQSEPFYASEVPRFTAPRIRNRRKRPEPVRRQEGPEALDVAPVSPIQTSFGGLTGLQGLPPLSLIQFVKLLVAVTPFIIPIVFVPLLIFTIGMFMIPVTKTKIFVGGDAGVRENSVTDIGNSWTSWGYDLMPSFKTFARSVANHEECLEKLICEIGKKYLPSEQSSPTSGKEVKDPNMNQLLNRKTLQRVLNYFNHPLSHKISRSLQIPPDTCGNLKCRPASFLQKLIETKY